MPTTPPLEAVTLRREDGIAVLTLNRPDRLNAIDPTMGRDLLTAWQMIDADDDVRVVIVTGAGRGFCTGLDVGSRATDGVPEQRAYAPALRLTAIHNGVWKPVVTAVNGVCAGGGLHFIADSDITICSETATFL